MTAAFLKKQSHRCDPDPLGCHTVSCMLMHVTTAAKFICMLHEYGIILYNMINSDVHIQCEWFVLIGPGSSKLLHRTTQTTVRKLFEPDNYFHKIMEDDWRNTVL